MDNIVISYFDEEKESIIVNKIEVKSEEDKEIVKAILNNYAKPTKIEVKSPEFVVIILDKLIWYVNFKLMEKILKKIKEALKK